MNPIRSAGVSLGVTPPLVASALLLLCVLPGCRGMLYRQTGKVMSGYAQEHMVPQLMGDSDVGMACETGVSMGAFLLSFKRVVEVPAQVGAVTMLSAAMCAEGSAWEEELRGLRALHAGRAAEAADARIGEKRAHAVAASRFLRAYQLTAEAYGPLGVEGAACPALAEEDGSFYLLGLSAGLLAVIHDRAAEGVVGVPMNIPASVIRASACLDNARWWGVPAALRAALWISVPGKTPKDADPWAVLEQASAIGDKAGVRLARAFEVQAAAMVGNREGLQQAVAAHAASLEAQTAAPAWRLLDRYATQLILHESDRLWSSEEGHRTPSGALGTFPGAAQASPVDDSLLDGLDED